MAQALSLPYGTHPFEIFVPKGAVIADLPVAPQKRELNALLAGALKSPIGSVPLEQLASPGASVVIALSDATRDDPRDEMIEAILASLPPDIALTLAIANGTHGPCDVTALGIRPETLGRARIINHDAHSQQDLVHVGTTKRGTPIRLHRCIPEADLVIATGRIKPHYFAGYGAGIKSIFPGLGGNAEIRVNHQLKSAPGSVAGSVEGNPCREDLEEVIEMLEPPLFLLNVVVDGDGGAQGAVAGDIRAAFREGAKMSEPLFRVTAPRSQLVVVSDKLPLTGSLYQASKLAAAAAPLVLDGGAIVLVAECPLGVGPLETVNQAIYQIGIKPRLPVEHSVYLVSGMERSTVEKTYCKWLDATPDLCSRFPNARPTILPRAGSAIVVPEEASNLGS